MRIALLLGIILTAPALVAQQMGADGIDVLITRLGSANLRQRDAAMEALKKDPKSASALREALRSADAEIAKRVAVVLEYHDRRPVRELVSAAKEGRINALVELLAEWPVGKYEPEAWNAVRDLIGNVARLHHEQGGKKLELPWLREGVPIVVVGEPLVKEIRNNKLRPDGELEYFFVRTRKVELLPPPEKPRAPTGYYPGGAFVASGSVKHRSEPVASHTIIAGGPVEIDGITLHDVIISCGDVNISSFSLGGSLVVARGKVTCTGVMMGDCRIISGKSVAYDKKKAQNCIITENEPNPLGYIRWSDSPNEKGKAAPKSK